MHLYADKDLCFHKHNAIIRLKKLTSTSHCSLIPNLYWNCPSCLQMPFYTELVWISIHMRSMRCTLLLLLLCLFQSVAALPGQSFSCMPFISWKKLSHYIEECLTFWIWLIVSFLCHLICWRVMHDGIDSEMKYFSPPKMEARETNDWDDEGKAVCVLPKGFHHFGEMECELLVEGSMGGTVARSLRTESLK